MKVVDVTAVPSAPVPSLRRSRTAVRTLAQPTSAATVNAQPDWVTTTMRTYTAVVERCSETGLYVGYVPGFPGAHSQGETLDELNVNLREVIALILDDGAPAMVGEYVGTQTVVV